MNTADRLVINFHGIGDPWEGVPADELAYWCPRETWPLLADELAALREEGQQLDITFDDGNRTDLTEALPTLMERGLKATFFVCAGRIGTPRYLDAGDLRDLASAGMGIGSHGWGHRDLRRLDRGALRQETSIARSTIQEASGYPVDEFAIPFGSYDRRVLRSLKGHRRVFTSDGGRMSPSDWLAPRTSYVRSWQPGHITYLANTRAGLAARIQRHSRTLFKSMR